MKILVGVNTLTTLDTEVVGSLCNFWYRLGKMHPDKEFIMYHPRRTSIDRMRNNAAIIALDKECDYLMFIDDDIIMDRDVLDCLLKPDKDITAALTFIRGYPFNPMSFKYVTKYNVKMLEFLTDEDLTSSDGYISCDAVGFACVLIKCSLLKQIREPYFMTGSMHTEDIYFCCKAKEEVPDCSIYTCTLKPTLHLLDKQPIGVNTRAALKTYYEALGYNEDNNPDRALEYVQKCITLAEEPVNAT